MYDEGLLPDSFMFEFCTRIPTCSPAAVRQQVYNGLNPYALGFAMYRDSPDLRGPDREDRRWFPEIAGATG